MVTLPVTLSVAMREGSRTEHAEAEESTFVVDLLAGRIPPSGYVAYLERLRVVYETLEKVLADHLDDPLVAAVHDPALERLAAIDADLEHWDALAGSRPGTASDRRTPDSPAADAYRDRLLAARHWGGLLVAHHYTRYLGDLSGGQAVGRSLDRTFDLGGQGLAFYVFPQVPKPKPYKDAYRARLDALDLSPTETARVVDEVRAAFALNRSLFVELEEIS